MAKRTIRIAPYNGLSLPGLGHLAHGEHELELTDEQIELFDSEEAEGVSLVEAKAKKEATGNTKPEAAEALHAAIKAAIAGLNPDQANGEVWTKAEGVPQTAALSNALGYPVSAAERDAALATG